MTLQIFGPMRNFLRVCLSVISGGLLAQGANGHGWWLTVLGLAMFLGLLQHQEKLPRVLSTAVVTSVWFGIHVSWIKAVGIDAWLLLVLLCILPWLLLALIRLPQRGWAQYVVTASGVVLVEWLHDNVPWGGFPWGNLAYSQIDGPLVGLSLWGGQSLVAVAVTCAAVACLQLVRQRKLLRGMFMVGALTLSSHYAFPTSIHDGYRSTDTAVIQGGPDRTAQAQQQPWAVFNRHIIQTQILDAAVRAGKFTKPSLIVWPENSTDVDPLNNAAAYKRINDLVNRVQVPILIGGVTWQGNPYGPRNAGILWMPNAGPEQIYAKTHLVPFGEYIPLRGFLADHIGRLSQIPEDFIPGNRPGLFNLNDLKFGDLICFEIAYENHLTALVNGGAEFITLQTNNATYLGTQQSKQQFAIARFRAIEHRRSVVMASTTGISGLIGWDGSVIVSTEQGESTFRSTEIQVVNGRTFTDRHPHWVIWTSLMLLALYGLRRIRKKSRVRHNKLGLNR
jgi:apolipoprotein N-acyltransferase